MKIQFRLFNYQFLGEIRKVVNQKPRSFGEIKKTIITHWENNVGEYVIGVDPAKGPDKSVPSIVFENGSVIGVPKRVHKCGECENLTMNTNLCHPCIQKHLDEAEQNRAETSKRIQESMKKTYIPNLYPKMKKIGRNPQKALDNLIHRWNLIARKEDNNDSFKQRFEIKADVGTILKIYPNLIVGLWYPFKSKWGCENLIDITIPKSKPEDREAIGMGVPKTQICYCDKLYDSGKPDSKICYVCRPDLKPKVGTDMCVRCAERFIVNPDLRKEHRGYCDSCIQAFRY